MKRWQVIRCGRSIVRGMWRSPRCVRHHGHRGGCKPNKQGVARLARLR